MKKIVFLGAVISLIATSCTVQKRVYNSGYHVTWNHSQKGEDQEKLVEKISEKEVVSIEIKSNNVLSSENENGLIVPVSYRQQDEIVSQNDSPSNFSNKKDVKSVLISDSKNERNSFRKNDNTFSKITSFKSLKKSSKAPMDEFTILLIILCFLIPPLAVGLATNWETTPLIISLILTFLFWIPGIIYALIKVNQNA